MGVGVQFFAKKQKYYQNNDTSFDFFFKNHFGHFNNMIYIYCVGIVS